MAEDGVVIVGGGLAAAQTAIQLRQRRWQGPIVMLSAEADAPYWKPPLSKSVLQGTEPPESALIRPAEFWARRRIELRLNTAVARLEPAGRLVVTAQGEALRYGAVVLATGAYAVAPALPGLDLAGVHGLRGLGDAVRLRDAVGPGARVAVLGGGFIGLEAASALSARGATVTVIEREARLLGRVASPPMAEAVLALHRRHGVTVVVGRAAVRAEGEGRVRRVVLDDGREIGCDVLLVCVGVRPEISVAAAAGLACQDGIVVDEAMRAGHEGIWAAGDCVRFPAPRYGRALRLETIQHAIESAGLVAAGICGEPGRYDALPMVSSVQFGQALDFIGLAEGADDCAVVRDDGGFVVVHGRAGVCQAVECLNAAPEAVAAWRRAIAAGERFDAAGVVPQLQAGG